MVLGALTACGGTRRAIRSRTTLSLPAIAASRHTALVYMDAEKSALMDAVLAEAPETM